jgi:hypothetical protein
MKAASDRNGILLAINSDERSVVVNQKAKRNLTPR